MIGDVDSTRSTYSDSSLDPDFTSRLAQALAHADHERRRHVLYRRLQRLLPVALLCAPIVAWRLMIASPDGVHVAIGALAWVAVVLDVMVHVDTVVLAYLHLQLLPTIVGILLLILVSGWLLTAPNKDK